jgi:hypothetical protein
MVLDMEFFTKLMDILIFKMATIVSDNGLRDTIVTYDVIQDDFGYLITINIGQWDSFDPFGKVLVGTRM